MEDEKKQRQQDQNPTHTETGPRTDMGPRDEAPPGTPGTGEDIDPKTGETYIKGIGGG